MTRTKRHMAVNIEGLLSYHKRKKILIMEDDDGNRVSDKEARKFLAECQAKGYKLIPREDCEGFDPFEKGCPGHPIPDESPKE